MPNFHAILAPFCDVFGVWGALGVGQGRPRRPRGRPGPPRLDLYRFWCYFGAPFGSILGSFWLRFCVFFASDFLLFFIDFLMPFYLQNGTLLGRFLVDFETKNL